MIRFAPKIELDVAPSIKIATSNAEIRSDIGVSDVSITVVGGETKGVDGKVEPLTLSGESPSKGRKTSARKRKEIARSQQTGVGARNRDQTDGNLVLDL